MTNADDDTECVWDSFRREILTHPDYDLGGCETMDRIRDWSRRWPGHVERASCDDIGCANSDVWLICHRRADGINTATTILHVPQCHGLSWPPYRMSIETVTAFVTALTEPPPMSDRERDERQKALFASVEVAPRLLLNWAWRLDGTPLGASVACPDEDAPGSSFELNPECVARLAEALRQTLTPFARH